MLCMFTMMNQARLGVGLEGVGIADRAYQQALAFAQERTTGPRRRQEGRRLGPDHRASRRQADADADARADRGGAHDLLRHRGGARRLRARHGRQGARRRRRPRRAADADRKGVLHRHRQRGRLRSACRSMAAWDSSRKPARRSIIATRASPSIYEGTNGIQSIDLVTRKLAANGGASVWALLDELVGNRQAGRGLQRSRVRHDRRKTARRAGLARPLQPLAAGARHLGAERCAGRRDALSAAVRIDARRLHARRRSARRRAISAKAPAIRSAMSRWRGSSPRTSPCRPARWKDGDRQRRSRERRGCGAAGVERSVVSDSILSKPVSLKQPSLRAKRSNPFLLYVENGLLRFASQ